ncbi:caspase family protein [uncultured Thiocystis sp.]|jgi:uncharacterized caspase-like protein|uniref:caspase family protein n=1 Tax=uncultured Thiocystis sp. TaxID=1202134 RepID=UPI0025E7AE1C|nr:caspase family protein [uncultured Thiocystis sp.]
MDFGCHGPRRTHGSTLALLLVSILLGLRPLAAEERHALVIGNSSYTNGALSNPVNDATDIAAKLTQRGFEVVRMENADHRTMEQAIRTFNGKLTGPDRVGLFYFAGHGMEYEGHNYLIPIGTEIQSEVDLPYQAVDAGWVLDGMTKAGNGLNLLILDACRNNPFGRSFRSARQGLQRMSPPRVH